jgi:two-component system heavy metal sensor histidine kinase CusS
MFRIKIATFSFLTSGLIFLLFAAMFLSYSKKMALERTDRQLAALASSPMRHAGPDRGWAYAERWANSLAEGDSPIGRVLILETDWKGKTCYCSSNWPASFRPSADILPKEPPHRPGLTGPQPFQPVPEYSRPDFGPNRMMPQRRPPRGLFFIQNINGTNWRLMGIRRDGNALFIGIDLTPCENEWREMRNRFLFIGLAALLLLAAGGWLLANQALKPVAILTERARNLTAKDLAMRIHAPTADKEFRDLIDVINGMLERLERSFQQAARFSADAAHELKTPLAILQGEMSQALQRQPDGSPEQQAIASQLEEVERLKSIVRKLLLLAQSDAGQLPLAQETVSISELVSDLFEDIRSSASGLSIESDIAPGVNVRADKDLLRQLIQNLFSNAVKYNIPNGKIRGKLSAEDGNVIFTIANTFDPANPPDPARLFQRFYRRDPSRASRVEGHGLGLSLARELAHAHGGELTASIDKNEPSWLTLRLIMKEEKDGTAKK